MTKKYLEGVYEMDYSSGTNTLYSEWAASYDEEVSENGYATPRRCAEALAEVAHDRTAPLLDIGCGTGLSGLALKAAGFAVVDGTDVSEEMIEQAKSRQGIYRRIQLTSLDDPFPFQVGDYANMAAIGVFSPGHAPPETMDHVLALLPPGGCFCFSLNDHALADPRYEAKIDQVIAAGTATSAFREHGPHLPGIGLECTVYALRKT
ncbi:MAG: methyltransferase domain-containing protein [Pseudomonadota bacterium]